MNSQALEEARRVAPVLARMIELLGTSGNEGMKFASALHQAASETGISIEVGSTTEAALLTSAFRVISGGRIPGAPDA